MVLPRNEIRPAQGLVRAVLAPGLGQCLQLAIGRLAAKLCEVPLDALHFREAQGKLASAAQVQ